MIPFSTTDYIAKHLFTMPHQASVASHVQDDGFGNGICRPIHFDFVILGLLQAAKSDNAN